MGRFLCDVPFNGQSDAAFGAAYQYLNSIGYSYIELNRENVFKKGKGFLTGPSIIKITFVPNAVRIEAWTKFALLPGIYIGEYDLDGFVGKAMQKKIKAAVAQLQQLFSGYSFSPVPIAFNNGNQNQSDNFVFCTNCGTKLANNTAFCTSCGHRI